MLKTAKKLLTATAVSGLTAIFLSTSLPDVAKADTAGTILGGGAGAAIGSTIGNGQGKLVAVAVGTLIGAVIGNNLGDTRATVAKSPGQRALPTATPVARGPIHVYPTYSPPKPRYPGYHLGRGHPHGHGRNWGRSHAPRHYHVRHHYPSDNRGWR